MSPAGTGAAATVSESLAETWSGRVGGYLKLRRSLGFDLAWHEHLLRQFTGGGRRTRCLRR